ncbi:LuxR family transcriptional regulator [Streptomyces sp. NPDC004658]|uniref:helix-turn-helix transcriptional regulator n=1 Tax=Streptomyces sp. NPDC004658 TaxID=3154672 RepID=UPI0033B0EC54
MSGTADTVASLPVRGRKVEQKQITQWVRRHVHRNGGGVLWIEGPAGAGRSRMLACAGNEAALAGARVLTGAGMARGRMTPLAPLLDALTTEADDFVQRLGKRAREETTAYWLLREIAGRLRELTHGRPIVLLIDDVNDCDDLTLLAIRTLTVQLAEIPLLWVLTSRSHPDVPTVRSLRRDLLARQAARLALPPLAPEAVRQVVGDLLGEQAALTEPYLSYLGGLPGTVRQLCAHLQEITPTGPNTPPEGDVSMPTVLTWLVTRRLDELSEGARELVTTASVLGDTVTVQHLAGVLGRSELTLITPVNEVVAAGLLRAEDDRLVFVHGALREVVSDTLPSPVRLSVRRRSVQIREQAGVSRVSLAAELIGMAESEDAWAGRILRDAAQELAVVAPGTATRYLKRAVELTGGVCRERQRLTAELLPLLWQTGEVAQARDLAREVIQTPPDAATHARACLELARMSSQFRFPQPENHIRQTYRRRDVPVSVKDQLLAITMLTRLLTGEIDETGGTVAGSLMRTRGVHPVGELTYRLIQSMSAAHRHNWTDAVRHSDAVAALVAQLDQGRAAALPEVAVSTSWRASLLHLSGDDRSALNMVDDALEEAERRGRQALLPLWRTARARLLLDSGQLTAAARELAAADEAIACTGLPFTGEPAALYTRARVAFHMGDDAGVEACAAQAGAMLKSEEPQRRRAGAWVDLITAAYRDEALTVRQLNAASAYVRRGFSHAAVIDPGDAVLLVRMALACGQREVALRIVEFIGSRVQHNTRLPLFEAAAAHARGLLDRDRAKLTEAVKRYGTARPLLRAQAWEDAGVLSTATDAAEARACLERALESYEACGADRESRRVRSLLRKLGTKSVTGPGAPTTAPGTPDSGWRGLTPAELGVVHLIARGATNRQAAERLFLSPHTVNTHVRHAFEKLGIRSRVQLARLYLQEVDQPVEAF